ncbi:MULTISPECIES: PspC domain-containing protein [Actinoalloteichus]|nr:MULTISPECIES: PspC domain-containing protein [Actinoalloteichus]
MTEHRLVTDAKSRLRRIRRSRQDRMLAGVSGGLGTALGVDPALVRIGFVVLSIIGLGLGVAAYAVCWLIIPEEDY